MNGTVHGGQSPVKNSSVQLYAVGASGYGLRQATALGWERRQLRMATATSISLRLYTCPSGGLIYIVATQGDAGSGNQS